MKKQKPLTVAQVRRRRCFRCWNRPGYATWNICADGNRKRVVCVDCDIDLNRVVLRWAEVKNITKIMARYEKKARKLAATPLRKRRHLR